MGQYHQIRAFAKAGSKFDVEILETDQVRAMDTVYSSTAATILTLACAAGFNGIGEGRVAGRKILAAGDCMENGDNPGMGVPYGRARPHLESLYDAAGRVYPVPYEPPPPPHPGPLVILGGVPNAGPAMWVSLDRLEYLDCASLGEHGVRDVSTYSFGTAMMALMSIHPRWHRESGDIGDIGPIRMPGRWYGDRIALVGPDGFDGWDHDRIRSEMRDITGFAFAMRELTSNGRFSPMRHSPPHTREKGVPAPRGARRFLDRLIEIGEKSAGVAFLRRYDVSCDYLLHTPARVGGTVLPSTLEVLHLKSQTQVWIKPKVQREINEVLREVDAGMKPIELEIRRGMDAVKGTNYEGIANYGAFARIVPSNIVSSSVPARKSRR